MTKSETKEEMQEKRELTPDELTQQKQDEEFALNHEKLVLERADDRPLDYDSFPPPATSSWVVVPEGYWGEKTSDRHDGHAVQVVQVHTYHNAPTVVTLRCDCSYEWQLTWDGEAAEALFEATDSARKDREEKREAELERLRDEGPVDRS